VKEHRWHYRRDANRVGIKPLIDEDLPYPLARANAGSVWFYPSPTRGYEMARRPGLVERAVTKQQ